MHVHCTSFRGAKMCEIGKKGTFLVILTIFWKGHLVLKVSVYLMKPLLRAWLSQAFLAFKSCPQYHVVFFMLVCFDVWYWNKVWYDIWYEQFKKNACKKAYLGFIFIPEKYVFRVCFESPFTRMISSLKYKCPHPPPPQPNQTILLHTNCKLILFIDDRPLTLFCSAFKEFSLCSV